MYIWCCKCKSEVLSKLAVFSARVYKTSKPSRWMNRFWLRIEQNETHHHPVVCMKELNAKLMIPFGYCMKCVPTFQPGWPTSWLSWAFLLHSLLVVRSLTTSPSSILRWFQWFHSLLQVSCSVQNAATRTIPLPLGCKLPQLIMLQTLCEPQYNIQFRIEGQYLATAKC